ncbi:MAG: hypothetical protein OXB86_04295 [Bdellovibrionales bacterium]|nr:hypothetical protein [Bdellovibrionales bacterium]
MFSKHGLFLVLFLIAGCQPGSPPVSHSQYNPKAISLSFNNTQFKSCQYPGNTRIAHFPMFHYPPTGFKGDQREFERVSMSQFQLLHTILSYRPSIAVFSEGILTDHYNTHTYSQLGQGTDRTTFSRLDNTVFQLQERYNTAHRLFPGKVVQHYESLTASQKEFLAHTGGALTAWLLGQIPGNHIYKTASEQDLEAVTSNLKRISLLRYNGSLDMLFNAPEGSDPDRDYWLLHFRERRVLEEVNKFYRQRRPHPRLVLIAYGANHRFNDEFSAGFSDGSFCLGWHSL